MSLVLFSRGCRRLGFGWLATVASASNMPMGRFSSRAGDQSAVGVLEKLAYRLQEPENLRAPHSAPLPKMEKSVSKSDENRRRSELASELCTLYPKLAPLKLPVSDSCERAKIIFFLASDCSPKDRNVKSAIEMLQRPSGDDSSMSNRMHSAALTNLRRAATPAFEELLEFVLKQNTINGMEFLTSLREDVLQVLRWMKQFASDDEAFPLLKDLDTYLQRILSLWFSPGIIELKRITYEGTSASIIEVIAKKEAVHPMKSLEDLRGRLGEGRRVFSLFHPVLPDKPLVFVHVALLDGMPSGMPQVMEVPEIQQPKVAAFYSISNAQPGLVGVGLGEYLLKEAIQRLKLEFASLETFVTLSPIPGFRTWLEDKIRNNLEDGHFYDGSLVSEEELQLLERAGIISGDALWQSLLTTLENLDFSHSSLSNPALELIQPLLMKLASRYLLLEKHRGRPLDPVTRFHVGNGAVVHRINFAADLTRKGLKSSFGIMVNYRYDLERLSANQKLYETDYRIPSDIPVEEWLPPH